MYGIFGKTSLAYTIDREEEGATRKQPTLPQLTQAAIGVLSKDPDGFFLMVEGGANDDLKRLLQRGDGHLFFTLFPPPAEFPATPDGNAAFASPQAAASRPWSGSPSPNSANARV